MTGVKNANYPYKKELKMNLIEITKIVKEKETNRNRLLGKKDALMDDLKKLGFTKLSKAEIANNKIKDTLTKMRKHYTKGKEKFQEDFNHLLT